MGINQVLTKTFITIHFKRLQNSFVFCINIIYASLKGHSELRTQYENHPIKETVCILIIHYLLLVISDVDPQGRDTQQLWYGRIPHDISSTLYTHKQTKKHQNNNSIL